MENNIKRKTNPKDTMKPNKRKQTKREQTQPDQ